MPLAQGHVREVLGYQVSVFFFFENLCSPDAFAAQAECRDGKANTVPNRQLPFRAADNLKLVIFPNRGVTDEQEVHREYLVYRLQGAVSMIDRCCLPIGGIRIGYHLPTYAL